MDCNTCERSLDRQVKNKRQFRTHVVDKIARDDSRIQKMNKIIFFRTSTNPDVRKYLSVSEIRRKK